MQNRVKFENKLLKRDELLKTVKRQERMFWTKWSGYHCRSLVETKRSFTSQVNEIHARIAVLNKFTELDSPHTQVASYIWWSGRNSTFECL